MQSISQSNTKSYHIHTDTQNEEIIIHKNQTDIYAFMQIKKQKWIQLTIEFIDTSKTKITHNLILANTKLQTKKRLEKIQNYIHRLFLNEKISFDKFKETFKKLDEKIKKIHNEYMLLGAR